MRTTFKVHHNEHVSSRSFEEVVSAFESVIYEEPASRTTRLTYDLPSSLMSGLKNKKVTAAAKKLDAKLIALAVHATGVEA